MMNLVEEADCLEKTGFSYSFAGYRVPIPFATTGFASGVESSEEIRQ